MLLRKTLSWYTENADKFIFHQSFAILLRKTPWQNKYHFHLPVIPQNRSNCARSHTFSPSFDKFSPFLKNIFDDNDQTTIFESKIHTKFTKMSKFTKQSNECEIHRKQLAKNLTTKVERKRFSLFVCINATCLLKITVLLWQGICCHFEKMP